MRYTLGLLALALALLAATLQVAAIPPQDEGPAAACDNNREGKSKGIDHTCECEHATHCDPNSEEDRGAHKEMSSKCRTYCKPEHCSCSNECD